MQNKLPLIELKIDPKSNKYVTAVSLVENPAFQSNFIAFSEDHKEIKFTTNDEKKELLGVSLIPNKPIYRKNDEGREYYVTFSKETIREIAQTFSKKGLNNKMNLEHSFIPAESYIFQSYIVDSKLGLSAPKGLENDAIDGSWVVGVKVENDSVWNGIKTGKINGFSVEGIFDLIDTNTLVDLHFQEIQKEETLENLLKELSDELDLIIEKGFL